MLLGGEKGARLRGQSRCHKSAVESDAHEVWGKVTYKAGEVRRSWHTSAVCVLGGRLRGRVLTLSLAGLHSDQTG